ncbi:MAG: hypothetical protein ABW023_01730 [Sphingomonas sp.]
MSYMDRLSDAALADAARTVVDHDQYDDWVPDPVYFDDLKAQLGQPAAAAALVRRLASAPFGSLQFRLPRASSSILRGLSLPPGLRVVAAAATLRIAPRIRAGLPRDRVVGFRYNPGGTERFSAPYEGIATVSNVLSARALFSGGRLIIVDVQAASQNMQWSRLSATLSRFGADPEDLAFIGSCYGSGQGLPSADDGWAFLLNYYFEPIDCALLARRVDFYRVRDEYIIFDASHAATVQQLLKAAGFASTVTGLKGAEIIANIQDACFDKVASVRGDGDGSDWSGDPPKVDFDVQETPYFTIRGTAECNIMDGMILSDSEELNIALLPDLTPRQVFGRLRAALGGTIDAVDLSPLLRKLWQARRNAVLRLRAADGPVDSGYLAGLSATKRKLGDTVAASRNADAAWTGHVCSVLLSDAGALDQATIRNLLAHAGSPGALLGGVAARTTLARSSVLGAEQILTDSFPGAARPMSRRWNGLMSYYLARRGIDGPLDRWLAACRTVEPALAERLTAARRLPV